jgi:hypothetical protein
MQCILIIDGKYKNNNGMSTGKYNNKDGMYTGKNNNNDSMLTIIDGKYNNDDGLSTGEVCRWRTYISLIRSEEIVQRCLGIDGK